MKTLFSTSINKAAWLIRKAAAKDLGVGVKEISWKICLDMAKKGEDYEQKNKAIKEEKKEPFYIKPEYKMLCSIWNEFTSHGKYEINMQLNDIILIKHDIENNKNNNGIFTFHIKPKNWDGNIAHLKEWWIKLTKTGKVKKHSLRLTKYQ